MTDIEEAISWSGLAVILLFTLGASDSTLQPGDFEVAGMKPDNVKVFRLDPDPDGRRGVVQAYDLTFADSDHDFVPYLQECLRRAAAEVEGIAWLAFEGSFHYDRLFTQSVTDQVYGYCVEDGVPVAVWDGAVLKSGRWKCELAGVRAAMERAFPKVGTG
ncbi:hypothetical protein [Streptomyces sp. NBC_00102]|uniref:hypothetical protein n=1 Tax=Streptomyces sp. NBC_00102 TaxID=2975652 RepID=UPI0022541AD7|nr:hypothetical protein [Streptomyces sp. NBC_00102]MCX5398957.1 hypothetical protein [Streptomyces sp. NBC_00102]